MANCLVMYECETRGCYGESVGMSMYCPGVESRKSMAAAEKEGKS